MAFDLQRSVKDAPVFNSENHLIPDRERRYVPPEHVRAVLWQSAVHGGSATTIWVWERTFDMKSDFAGSIMHRPACAEAVGLTCCDLNRLAEEVTALQRLKPQAVLLHSVTALVWDGGRYTDARDKLYTALAFTGLKLGFVTERMLERGELPDAPLLFVPGIVHLSDAAFETLGRYRGRLILVGGDGLLSRNEYDRERGERLEGERVSFEYGRTTWRKLWEELLPRLERWGVRPMVEVRDAEARAARVYWQAVARLLPPEYGFAGRDHASPDPFNLALNYGYGILYARCERALVLAGLDPYGGFMHAPKSGKTTLVFDFIEQFRPVAVDKPLIFAAPRLEVYAGTLTRESRRAVATVVLEALARPHYHGSTKRPLDEIILRKAWELAAYLRGSLGTYAGYRVRW